MPRIAGDNEFYEMSLLTLDGVSKGPRVKIPSVSTILKALPKDGLQWWGYKLGMQASRELAVMRKEDPEAFAAALAEEEAKFPVKVPADSALPIELLYETAKNLGRKKKMTTPSNVLADAGDRGTDIHEIAEYLMQQGKPPPKKQIPADRLPYVEGLWEWYKKFIRDQEMEVVAIESQIFSLPHFYAGTLDLIVKSKDGGMYAVIDFKTSKGIYESHQLQSSAYAHAAIERGLIPRSAIAVMPCVVRIDNGAGKLPYEVVNSPYEIDDFLTVRQVWELLERGKPSSWYTKQGIFIHQA